MADCSPIEALKFKAISEDELDRTPGGKRTKTKRAADQEDYGGGGGEQRLSPPAPSRKAANFSLEYSYPAVIFDRICFSVDRSQQQSNFLNECLCRLGNCFPSAGGTNNAANKVDILKSIDLSVPYGSIFGLLGPSSCGKTTLLRCLVGLLKPSSGSIRLFGHHLDSATTTNNNNDHHHQQQDADPSLPLCFGCCGCRAGRAQTGSATRGTRRVDCKVPGSNVGYMPQDLGLYEDFTIRQILTMFGRYMGLQANLIEARIKFMSDFLELPDSDRVIQSLSGGQKRRVSFAIACFHMPPLIILDEPTVGVDPLLRQSIWKYLRRLASEENKTIIITTHYIEEAAQADQVALMRAGEILVQDTPSKIMQLNNSRTLEEAFLKICNNVDSSGAGGGDSNNPANVESISHLAQTRQTNKLCPQPKFSWNPAEDSSSSTGGGGGGARLPSGLEYDSIVEELKLRAQEKLELFDKLRISHGAPPPPPPTVQANQPLALPALTTNGGQLTAHLEESNRLSMAPGMLGAIGSLDPSQKHSLDMQLALHELSHGAAAAASRIDTATTATPPITTTGCKLKSSKSRLFKRSKLTFSNELTGAGGYPHPSRFGDDEPDDDDYEDDCSAGKPRRRRRGRGPALVARWQRKLGKSFALLCALLYKNYRRNVNSLPLLVFQFMLPVIQMVSFSLCVGGRPTSIGLGLVNHDQAINYSTKSHLLLATTTAAAAAATGLSSTITSGNRSSADYEDYDDDEDTEPLSLKFLSFIDRSMIEVRDYASLPEALDDVRRTKLWAVMLIHENFTASLGKRFDLENFYQLDAATIQQSVIKLYPDRSNRILDSLCQRSLVDSYRRFLAAHFKQLGRLPIDTKQAVYAIKPNAISNSIDGYTESIAPGLLASLTYIMAAGLTTFIMVVERSAGILERTYTSGINPVVYLLAHAIFRSLVMMLQIALVLVLTFYVLRQPLVGSLWLAYCMLMTLNLTGIAYGLLISSLVTDQNGAALTIVSSLVAKITLSGILWPLEAIPRWLRLICYLQPLTWPIQALKGITLKGYTLADRPVQLGFLVSLVWLAVFLTIAARRFKFYQH